MQYEYILLDVTKNDYVYNFDPNNPLILRKGAEVGVKNISLWNTLPNISPKYQNNTFKYDDGGGFQDVVIPEGMYDIKELDSFLKEKCDDQIRLSVNFATFKVKLLLDDVFVDFSEGKLHELLGLEAKVYRESEEGKNLINITRSVDRLLIRTNIVERPFQNKFNDVIYDILPLNEPGSIVHENPDSIEFHRCRDLVIRQIRIRITDDNNNNIEMTEHMTLKLVFRH